MSARNRNDPFAQNLGLFMSSFLKELNGKTSLTQDVEYFKDKNQVSTHFLFFFLK